MVSERQRELLRGLPQVDEVIKLASYEVLARGLPAMIVAKVVRELIETERQSILASEDCLDVAALSSSDLAVQALVRTEAFCRRSLTRVINASGVIIHTNLGRSILSQSAIDAVVEVASNYSTLEYDPLSQSRGSRHKHCERLICALTGAEAAIVVNNNAAAVLLVLSEFAAQGETIISRGELVEIGGSFRIPDIMRLSGTTMIEVGTTNKTHLADYERALSPDTAMLLKVHPSNYRLVGFAQTVELAALKQLASGFNAKRLDEARAISGEAQAGGDETQAGSDDTRASSSRGPEPQPVLVYEDQGSGSLVDFSGSLADSSGFSNLAEPVVSASLNQGADLVSFSGDKLLGGPQCGVVVGSRALIDRLKEHPLARALRCGKMTLAALEATLLQYVNAEAFAEIPTLRMLSAKPEDLKPLAEQLLERLSAVLPENAARLELCEVSAFAGGGALPMTEIPSWAVRISFIQGSVAACESYLAARRDVPVIARASDDALLFDVRCLAQPAKDCEEIAQALCDYFTNAAR